MLPGHPYRVVVASLNICRWGVGCHAQTGRECQSYDPRDTVELRQSSADLRIDPDRIRLTRRGVLNGLPRDVRRNWFTEGSAERSTVRYTKRRLPRCLPSGQTYRHDWRSIYQVSREELACPNSIVADSQWLPTRHLNHGGDWHLSWPTPSSYLELGKP